MKYFFKSRYLVCLIFTFSMPHLVGCNYSRDSLGSSSGIFFPVSRKTLEVGMDSIFSKNPQYMIPEKWRDLDNWSQRGFGFLNGKIVYFKISPEEMYYVTILGDSVGNRSNLKTTIAIRAINIGYRWFKYNELSDEDRKRINDRFNEEIVPKLEVYTNSHGAKETE